jgi:hypothetical protein
MPHGSPRTNQVQYRHAYDSSNAVIDIESVGREQRCEYKCISCGGQLVAVIGRMRQRHFRHKHITVSCSFETYLHQLGKKVFLETYESCLKQGEKFEIVLMHRRECTRRTESMPSCRQRPRDDPHDLTKTFRRITLESRDDSFIPDLMLLSDSDDKIYVEIAVTHASTEKKVSSKARLIEIQLANEDDLSLIRSRQLHCRDSRVKFYNFKPKVIFDDFASECSRHMSVFVLTHDGTARILDMTCQGYRHMYLGDVQFRKVVDLHSSMTYISELASAYRKGFLVRNCFLCRYHGEPRGWGYEAEKRGPIFCKTLKENHNSNDASSCSRYRPDPKVFLFSEYEAPRPGESPNEGNHQGWADGGG